MCDFLKFPFLFSVYCLIINSYSLNKMPLSRKQMSLKLIYIFLLGGSFVILVAWKFDKIDFPVCPTSIKKLKLRYQFIVAKTSTMHNKRTFFCIHFMFRRRKTIKVSTTQYLCISPNGSTLLVCLYQGQIDQRKNS